MSSIYNSVKIKQTFWLNKNNWLINSEDKKYITIKQSLLESIISCRSVADLSFKILEDIDCLTCLLNTHIIKSNRLIRKINSSSLIKNQDYVLHILNIGVADESVCQYLLTKNKNLKQDAVLAYKILSLKNDYFYFNYFKNLLKDEQFTLNLFKNKKFNNPFSLVSLPYNEQISKILIERQGFPNEKTTDLFIEFNLKVLSDINFIRKQIRKFAGHALYKFLPQNIKNNQHISLTMLKYHPEYNVVSSELKTIKNFKDCSKFWFYSNDFIDQIKFFDTLFNDDDNLFEALNCLKNVKSSRFDSSSFIQHPMLSFIIAQSSTSQLMKDFLNTEKGLYLLSIPIDSSNYISEIDSWIYEEFLPILVKIRLYHKISKLKVLDKQKTIKI